MYQVQSSKGLEYKIAKAVVEQALNQDAESWDWVQINEHEYSLIVNQKSHHILIESIDTASKTVRIFINDTYYTLSIEEPIDVLLKKMGIDLSSTIKVEPLKAPMPGLVFKILVEEGQEISKGTPLLILEAMKMENVFKASSDATIRKILVEEGQAVEKSAVLIELD